MDRNLQFALFAAAIGIVDIGLARVIADKFAPPLRAMLTYGGLAFLGLAVLFALRVIRISGRGRHAWASIILQVGLAPFARNPTKRS